MMRPWMAVAAVACLVAGLAVAANSFLSEDREWTCYGEGPGGGMNETFHAGRCVKLVGQPLLGVSLVGLGIAAAQGRREAKP